MGQFLLFDEIYIWFDEYNLNLFNIKNLGSPPLYSLLPLRAKTHFFKMRLVVAGGGFLFYCTTQHIKLDMESEFVQIKR